jgi:hypothetical protein
MGESTLSKLEARRRARERAGERLTDQVTGALFGVLVGMPAVDVEWHTDGTQLAGGLRVTNAAGAVVVVTIEPIDL